MDEGRNELIVDEFLKLKADDVLAADVNGVARRDVKVVDVDLGSVVKDVGVLLNDNVELLIDIDVAE